MDRRNFISTAVAAATAFAAPPSLAQSPRPLLGYIRSNWSRDPFSFGSYSFFAKGSKRRDTRALARPIDDSIFFAGEATHPECNSTVHAAFESGLIAAKKISSSGAARIAIVGAGMAGLTAGEALLSRGQDVTILEGRKRIGGRMWTDSRLGLPLDIGASWIHGDQGNPLIKEAALRGVETEVTDDSFIVKGRDGRQMSNSELPRWLDEVIEIQHSAGAGSDEINARAYWQDEDYDGEDLLLPGGYSQLLSGKAEGADLRLGWTVRHINYGASGVLIENTDGKSLSFDAALITVPLGVLKAGGIAFEPPLPSDKREAIDRLGMGVLDKVYLKYADVFWDTDTTWIATPENGLPPGQFNQWLNLYPYTDQPIIMAFNGAQPARDLSALSDNAILERATSTLAQAYP